MIIFGRISKIAATSTSFVSQKKSGNYPMIIKKKKTGVAGGVVYTCDLSMQEAEAKRICSSRSALAT
jgi:hypothetical protein